jgi:ATP-dependent helicase/nuclease subunit A
VLILVRARGAFFEAMIRALKETDVKTLGADRLLLAEHIAVMDLVAAGKAALSEDDDLALAAALKSPLFGFDDDDLIALAPQRKGSLAGALAAHEGEKYRAAARQLALWRERARALTPYDFYARLLGEEGGKRAMLGRLGPEAGDAIEEFLSLALAFAQRSPPSLIAFLAEVEAADVSIKRDMEESGDAVRVMTVHAAKGLEAAIVFLPDTCSAPGGREDGVLFIVPAEQAFAPPFIVWSPRKAEDPAAVAEARDERREATRGEHRRLLYVAMTRAAERLIIAGHHGVKGPAEDCWHAMALAGLGDALSEAPAPWGGEETILRLGEGASEQAAPAVPTQATEAPPPAWLTAPASETAPPTAISAAPASLQRVRGKPDAESRLEAGRLSHALLQYLPDIAPSQRREAGRRYLMRRGASFGEAEREAILDKTLAILDDPDLADLFGPASRGEVPIAAEFSRDSGPPASFVGRIDRLAMLADQVVIADFKNGALRPGAAIPGLCRAIGALPRRAPAAPSRPAGARLPDLARWAATDRNFRSPAGRRLRGSAGRCISQRFQYIV